MAPLVEDTALFATIVKMRRQELGLSQVDAAKLAGVTPSAIVRCEIAHKHSTLHDRLAISNALDLTQVTAASVDSLQVGNYYRVSFYKNKSIVVTHVMRLEHVTDKKMHVFKTPWGTTVTFNQAQIKDCCFIAANVQDFNHDDWSVDAYES